VALHQTAFVYKHDEIGDVVERLCGRNCKCRIQNLLLSTTKTFFAEYQMQNSMHLLLVAVSNVI
jgi:hypothetical protein